MTHHALVIPPDLSEPVRAITFEIAGLLDVLYAQTGVDCVDSSPRLTTPLGDFRMWVDDSGLMRDPVAHNDRAIALCRHVGYNVPDVGGVAVITGAENAAGDTLGLPEALLAELQAAFMHVVEAGDR